MNIIDVAIDYIESVAGDAAQEWGYTSAMYFFLSNEDAAKAERIARDYYDLYWNVPTYRNGKWSR